MTAKPKSWAPWFEKRKFRDPIGDRKRRDAGRSEYMSVWARSIEDMRAVEAAREQESMRKARMREIKFTAFLCVGYAALVFFLWLL